MLAHKLSFFKHLIMLKVLVFAHFRKFIDLYAFSISIIIQSFEPGHFNFLNQRLRVIAILFIILILTQITLYNSLLLIPRQAAIFYIIILLFRGNHFMLRHYNLCNI